MPELIKYFPPHKIWIEPFFGSGSAFFYKQKANHNIVNDIDSDVFNLFQVVLNHKEDLLNLFYQMPLHMDLFNYWRNNKEIEPVKKALRFILLSNYGYMGKSESFRLTGSKTEYAEKFEINLNLTQKMLFNVQFANLDFRDFFKSISFQSDGRNDEEKTLIYSDPPYVLTDNNYSDSFTETDHTDLQTALLETGCKFAISEFNNPFVMDLAKKNGLNIHIIGERQNLKNRRTEILITNYKINKTLFD